MSWIDSLLQFIEKGNTCLGIRYISHVREHKNVFNKNERCVFTSFFCKFMLLIIVCFLWMHFITYLVFGGKWETNVLTLYQSKAFQILGYLNNSSWSLSHRFIDWRSEFSVFSHQPLHFLCNSIFHLVVEPQTIGSFII